MSTQKRSTSAREILRRRYFRTAEQIASRDETHRQMALGVKIRRLREEAGMTQQELADKIGTQPSAISRIEDADYDAHSLTFLQKVADALDMLLLVDFAPKHPTGRGAKER